MTMVNEVFPLVLSLLPLGTYLLLIGALRITRRPLVTTLARDAAAVAIAISGLIMIGPAELFFPSDAAMQLGPLVWAVLIVLYALSASLIIMSMRTRIIIYGLQPREALEPLLNAARSIDPTAQLDREHLQVLLPERHVRLRIDPLGLTDAVQIEAFEKNLHPHFWQHMLLQIRSQTRTMRTPASIGGLSMLIVGLVMLTGTIALVASHPSDLLAGFRAWMRM